MSWLITGGTGQLGSAISLELSERGIPYTAWGSHDLDITQEDDIRGVVAKYHPKVIVNCAAWTDVKAAETNEQLALMVNSDGAQNVALAAKEFQAKLIQISTDYVFSGMRKVPWESFDEMTPESAYGRTKASGERLILNSYAENTLIIRTAWLYSPWGKNFAKTMTKFALRDKEAVKVVNDQIGQPTSASQVAKQLVRLVNSQSPSGIYHATNSGEATWAEFARAIFDFSGADVRRVIPVLSSEYDEEIMRPTYSVLSHKDWERTLVTPLENWKEALFKAMPSIIDAVRAEQ